jgi:rRNA maturation endonuclease Nob1
MPKCRLCRKELEQESESHCEYCTSIIEEKRNPSHTMTITYFFQLGCKVNRKYAKELFEELGWKPTFGRTLGLTGMTLVKEGVCPECGSEMISITDQEDSLKMCGNEKCSERDEIS